MILTAAETKKANYNDGNPVKIEFRVVSITPGGIDLKFHPSQLTAEEKKERQGALEMYDFIKTTANQHLTLGDVKKLRKGDVLDVIIWDRNWEEYGDMWQFPSPYMQPQRPKAFFDANKATLTYLGDMKWVIGFSWGDDFEHPVHINTAKLHDHWTWMEIGDCGCDDGENIDWKKLDDSTRVGWRGPMMLWDKLEDCPDVYHLPGYYGKKD